MRRLLISLFAAGVVAAIPAPAMAGGFVIDFHDVASAGVEVYNFSDCDSSCDPQAISVAVERGGTTIGSAGPSTSVRVPIAPAQGDIVRIFKGGVERAAVAYEGVPSLDDAPSCIAPGRTSFSGMFRHGVPAPQPFSPGGPVGGVLVDPYTALSVWRSGYRGQVAAETISTEGDRWTATFPEGLVAGEAIGLWHAYTIPTPVGVATVWSWRNIGACPPTVPVLPMPDPPPKPPSRACSAEAIADAPGFATRVTRAVRRVRLRALRKGAARLAGLPSCAGGTVTVEVKAGGAVVARGKSTATGAEVTQALTRTRRTKRLAGRRRARVKVTIRITTAPAAPSRGRAG